MHLPVVYVLAIGGIKPGMHFAGIPRPRPRTSGPERDAIDAEPCAAAVRDPRRGHTAGGHDVRGTIHCMSRLDRITTDPSICHGQPTVRGLRYPVESLLELLASGMTIEEVIEDHPDLERDDLLAAMEFGALVSGQRRVVPLGAA